MTNRPPDLHALPAVAWLLAVAGIAVGMGSIAGQGLGGLVVAALIFVAGALAFAGYRSDRPIKRWPCYLGAMVCVGVAIPATINPLRPQTPPPSQATSQAPVPQSQAPAGSTPEHPRSTTPAQSTPTSTPRDISSAPYVPAQSTYATVNTGPLQVTVTPIDQPPVNGFYTLVRDGSQIPPAVGTTTDCTRLWKLGLQSRGVPLGEMPMKLNLHNTGDHSIALVDLRATITAQRDPQDGTVLGCTPARGGENPIKLIFDLNRGLSAPATQLNRQGAFDAIFANGYQIALAPDEYQPLNVLVWTPGKAASWHFEATVEDRGHQYQATINNGGREFDAPGFRPIDLSAASTGGYRSGYVLTFDHSLHHWGTP